MKSKLLLPHVFKKYGWLLLILSVPVLIGLMKFDWAPAFLEVQYERNGHSYSTNALKEMVFTMWMVGLILIAFSKEKHEDEYISFVRLTSWQYAVLASVLISLSGVWLVWYWDYLLFSALNMLTVPVLFILIFNIMTYQAARKELKDEK
jgi:hypothetical protein